MRSSSAPGLAVHLRAQQALAVVAQMLGAGEPAQADQLAADQAERAGQRRRRAAARSAAEPDRAREQLGEQIVGLEAEQRRPATARRPRAAAAARAGRAAAAAPAPAPAAPADGSGSTSSSRPGSSVAGSSSKGAMRSRPLIAPPRRRGELSRRAPGSQREEIIMTSCRLVVAAGALGLGARRRAPRTAEHAARVPPCAAPASTSSRAAGRCAPRRRRGSARKVRARTPRSSSPTR